MIQILYEADHLNRAKTLAAEYPDSEYALVGSDPVKRKGLDTLVFWGHSGGNISLCSKSPAQIAQLVRHWKRLNSGLKTVEILTCDGRHATAGEKPLVRKVKSSLRSGLFSSTGSIIVKALPVAVAGSANSASILLADWETKSWVYISAPSNGMMFATKNKIEVIAKRFYPLREGDESAADVAQASGRLFKQSGEQNRTYSLNYGYFSTLRAHLGVVRSKDFSVATRPHEPT